MINRPRSASPPVSIPYITVDLSQKRGLYEVLMLSRKPIAKQFKVEVKKILKSIRKTGFYSVVPQTFAEALRLAADLEEKRLALEVKNQVLQIENESQKQIIGELQPKADYVDYILSSTGTITTTQIAADYDMSARELNKILSEERLQRYVGKQWILYKEHMGMGYTKSETIPITRTDGSPDSKPFTKWTQKGRLKINEILNHRGIYADVSLLEQTQFPSLTSSNIEQNYLAPQQPVQPYDLPVYVQQPKAPVIAPDLPPYHSSQNIKPEYTMNHCFGQKM